MAEFNRRKKKVCAMCTGKDVDYRERMVYVFEKNNFTAELKRKWDNHTLRAD